MRPPPSVRDLAAAPWRFLRRSHWYLLPWALLALAAGLLVQWSVQGPGPPPMGHLVRMAAAGAALVLAAWVPVRWWRRHAWFLYGLAVLLVAGVLVAGPATNAARRWIELPLTGFKLQPSEFLKLGLILALAKWFAERPRPERLEDLVVPAALTLLPAVLVLLQPDLGTALTYPPLFLAVAWAAGMPARLLRWFLLLPVLLVPLGAVTLHDYQLERVRTWWRQDHLSEEERSEAGYHLWHAKLAVGSGGWTGHGWGQGPENRLDRLPERHNDFAFAVLAEEFGFFGASLLVLTGALLAFSALVAAARHRDPFQRLVVLGVATHFGVHLILNTGVVLGLWPTTGLPLPLVSFGGSSMAVAGLCLGLVLSMGASREPVFLDRAWRG